MWRPELTRSCSRFADDSEKLPGLIEHRDSPDKIRICHVRVALSNIDITVSRVQIFLVRSVQTATRNLIASFGA
jgi:hypothetical protein